MIPKFISGGGAVALSLHYLSHGCNPPIVFIASLFLFFICITDTLSSKIPNLFTATALITALTYHGAMSGPEGLVMAGQGLLLGLLLLVGPYLLGGMGAGDVKALAALGSLIGPGAIFQTFLYMGLIGGGMAMAHYAMAGRLKDKTTAWMTALAIFWFSQKIKDLLPPTTAEKLCFPYAAAIALGYFSFLHWGPLLQI